MTNGQIITTLIILVVILAVLVAVLGYANDDARRRLSISRNKARNLAKRVYRAEAAVKGLELRLDKANDRIGILRQGARDERTNARRLAAEANRLRGENDAISVTRPLTPLPVEMVTDQLMVEIEAHLGKQGGEQR